jgi:hypothetical protein
MVHPQSAHPFQCEPREKISGPCGNDAANGKRVTHTHIQRERERERESMTHISLRYCSVHLRLGRRTEPPLKITSAHVFGQILVAERVHAVSIIRDPQHIPTYSTQTHSQKCFHALAHSGTLYLFLFPSHAPFSLPRLASRTLQAGKVSCRQERRYRCLTCYRRSCDTLR